jgi:hypothetical protein
MRNIIIGLAVMFLIASCRKESYEMQILIKNKSDSKLKITLYPKSKYMSDGLYDFCDFGGGYADTTFDIDSNGEKSLYISNNLNQKPFDLAAKIFDSIYIKPYDKDKIGMKFSIDKVTGYADNLFDNNSSWIYEKRNDALKTNFSTHLIESHDYSFIISQ